MSDRLNAHVAAVVRSHSARKPGALAIDLVPMLTKRIAIAKNKGLASSVFWHGQWFTLAEAKHMLSYLYQVARQEGVQQANQSTPTFSHDHQ